jgi:ribonuclease HI
MPMTVYTDGACRGNPGPGGWAAILIGPNGVHQIAGHVPHTTNNRMELQAALEALRLIPSGASVTLYTDSEYLRLGITQWMHAWVRNGWRTANKQPVKNAELWRDLSAAASPHHVTWRWVRGPAGDPLNTAVDALARAASEGHVPPAGTPCVLSGNVCR